jgi:hypothetical protein
MKKVSRHSQISKRDAVAFRKRWKMVNAIQEEELRALSPDEKLGQLSMLMTLAKELDWTEALAREASKVRNRWNKLRKVYHA